MILKVYTARRKSYGWLFLALFTLPLLILTGVFVHLYSTMGELLLLLGIFICLGAALPFLIVLANLPFMKYVLEDEKLVIKCGLLLKYTVPLAAIKRIIKRDLDISMIQLSLGVKFPGLSLFTVRYADVGKIKMCTTSLLKDIILIETDQGLYGITPTKEDEFIADLRSRIRGNDETIKAIPYSINRSDLGSFLAFSRYPKR